MEFFDHLNGPQQDAVKHVDGPLLILAGAGSGKTRVLTCRIAHLIQTQGVHPAQILAVTFTNKAAGEMRERVDHLLGHAKDAHRVTISTFHSLGARLLRRHADRLGLGWSFNIYDDDDQRRLIRKLLEDGSQPKPERSEIRRLQGYIESMKNQALTPTQAHEIAFDQSNEEDASFYEAYQAALREAQCVDFGDLLMGVLEIFRADPQLAQAYSEQWRFVMVDEFQDTNQAQYELLEHLTRAHRNLAVVGDDDQAIYRWRGATIANILDFENQYDDTNIIKLEQNYRSTQVILDAAGDVIQHNPRRHDKTLWTERDEGAPIICFTATDDREEAAYVAQTISKGAADGADYHDFAIFYRTNAQGRLFEEQLRNHGIPYKIVGGLSFYAREEIKDLLGYLKVALNPANEIALLRVINTPSRGVGKTTIAKLRAAASIGGINSIYGAARHVTGHENVGQHDLFSPRRPRPRTAAQQEALEQLEGLRGVSVNGIRSFCEVIDGVRDDLVQFDSVAMVIRSLIDRLNYLEYLDSNDPERAEDKRSNVGELVSALEEFERDYEEQGGFLQDDDAVEPADLVDDEWLADSKATAMLRAFLDRSALIQSADEADDIDNVRGTVTLMTVHGSKGLEFDTVFLVGMEDELFPSQRNMGDPEELEEERRLAYVAITRARDRLYVTNAKRRRVFGKFKDTRPSPFLLDIKESRLTIDPRSASQTVDYFGRFSSTRDDFHRGRGPGQFFGGGVDPSLWDFDQSPEMIRGEIGRAVTRARAVPSAPQGDEYSQLQPSWDVDTDWSRSPAGESVQWKAAARDGAQRVDFVGATVSHSRFGVGEVIRSSGAGDTAKLTVNFPTVGQQTVVRKFLKILG